MFLFTHTKEDMRKRHTFRIKGRSADVAVTRCSSLFPSSPVNSAQFDSERRSVEALSNTPA